MFLSSFGWLGCSCSHCQERVVLSTTLGFPRDGHISTRRARHTSSSSSTGSCFPLIWNLSSPSAHTFLLCPCLMPLELSLLKFCIFFVFILQTIWSKTGVETIMFDSLICLFLELLFGNSSSISPIDFCGCQTPASLLHLSLPAAHLHY